MIGSLARVKSTVVLVLPALLVTSCLTARAPALVENFNYGLDLNVWNPCPGQRANTSGV